jgi:hypothetical protein
MPGMWQCAQCKRRWAWATSNDGVCPNCGSKEGTEVGDTTVTETTRATPGADAETAQMQTGVAAHRAAIKRTVDDVGRAAKAVAGATDVLVAFQGAGAFIVACEAAEEAFADAKKRMRAYLSERMAETGATTISTEAHTFGLSRDPVYVIVTNEKLIAAQFWTTPKPTVDKKALLAEIKQRGRVDGAELSNSGAMHLTVRAKT